MKFPFDFHQNISRCRAEIAGTSIRLELKELIDKYFGMMKYVEIRIVPASESNCE